MALTKIPSELSSTTGIVDNSNATAITIDSNENVGIGTSSPSSQLEVQDANGVSLKFGDLASYPNNVVPCFIGTATSALAGINGDLVLCPRTSDAGNILFATGSGQAAERMRIDASGNVQVKGGNELRVYRGDNATYGSIKYLTGSGGLQLNDTNGDGISFVQANGATEYARIDSSGNVGIGTSSPSQKLHVDSGEALIKSAYSASGTTNSKMYFATRQSGNWRNNYIGNTGDALTFATGGTGTTHTNATERARIDSSGNLLVGTTTTSVTNAHGIQMLMQVGATKPRLNIATSGYTSTDYPLSIWSTGVSAWRFYVQADGRISAVYTTINSLSDERVKENIRDLDDGLSKVMQLQPRKFDWKEGKGKNITNDRGFIAQEFEQVFPDLVSEWKDEAPEGEEPYKSVSADLIPTLVKAIQEQQTLIESLTTRIAALEE